MNHFLRLGDGDAMWALGVAGSAVVVILALFLLTRCRLSLFTRKAKRKKLRKDKAVKKEPEKVKSCDSEQKGQKEGVIVEEKVIKKPQGKFASSKTPGTKKKETIIRMIDTVLGENEDLSETEDGKGRVHIQQTNINDFLFQNHMSLLPPLLSFLYI